MSFACVCLLNSTIWHVMAGCAHHQSMETCARIDYVGIGWLISASVATVANYGYQCHPQVGHAFIGICLAMGVLGNILPFMEWFNQYEYRVRSYMTLQIILKTNESSSTIEWLSSSLSRFQG